ncbi:hypothetical protein FH972_012226 [Carpinus fangiana]|uniref:BLOC-1-related complex subunit 6 C-terminal helix domain-containing protein n=1 Tax=Carpinus fangiana TaxID=176857 RepID=A0A5N6R377_9ROSI|nr:hypothetical protein FH972_012226 [Carpinus fangiana]
MNKKKKKKNPPLFHLESSTRTFLQPIAHQKRANEDVVVEKPITKKELLRNAKAKDEGDCGGETQSEKEPPIDEVARDGFGWKRDLPLKRTFTFAVNRDMEGGEEQRAPGDSDCNSEALISEPKPLDPPSTFPRPGSDSSQDGRTETRPTLDQTEMFRALEVLERDSVAIAESFTSLFDSLRLALSEVTSSSVDHMHCFNDAAGRLQESVLDAATKGNRYINSCLRLNEEMKGVDNLAMQLKILRRNVDALDSGVNRLLRLP